MTPAAVIRPICQEFGVFEGRTVSVVSDMARKSLTNLGAVCSRKLLPMRKLHGETSRN